MDQQKPLLHARKDAAPYCAEAPPLVEHRTLLREDLRRTLRPALVVSFDT